jgi:tetratricopeptide (TPR) repeat protein
VAESQVGVELFKVAEQRAAAGDIAVAARFAERAREVFEQAQEHDAACAAGSLEGRLRLQGGDAEAALTCFIRSQALAAEHDLVERGLGAATELGALHELTGNLDASLACHQEVLRVYRTMGDAVGIANALGNVGRLLTRMGRPDDASAHLQEALALFEGADETAGSVNALICLGDLARAQSRLADARQHFEAAISRADTPPARLLRAVGLLNLGHTLRDLGEREAAVDLFSDSLSIARDLGDVQGVARARLGQAMALADSRDPGASIAAFEEAEAAFLQIGQPPSALAATVNRAAVLCRVGRLIEGRDGLIHARELLRRMGDERGADEVALALCEVQLALGDHRAVDEVLRTTKAESHGARLALRAEMVRSRVAIRAGDAEQARALLDGWTDSEMSVAEGFALALMKAEIDVLLGDCEAADLAFAALLAQVDADDSPREHAAALMGRALAATWSANWDVARDRYEAAAGLWADLGEPLPHLQCALGLLRVDVLRGAETQPAQVAVIAEKLRDLGANDAATSADVCSRAIAMRIGAVADDESAPKADEVLAAVAELISRGNRLAAFSELAFAAAATDDAEIASELQELAETVNLAVPAFAQRRLK